MICKGGQPGSHDAKEHRIVSGRPKAWQEGRVCALQEIRESQIHRIHSHAMARWSRMLSATRSRSAGGKQRVNVTGEGVEGRPGRCRAGSCAAVST